MIQREVFDEVDEYKNPLLHCDALPNLDLRLWKENYACKISGLTLFPGESERITPCTMCVCTLEGPMCQSMRVRSCAGLLQRFTVEQVAKDTVCSVQCPKSLRITYAEVQKEQADEQQQGDHPDEDESYQPPPTLYRKHDEREQDQSHDEEDGQMPKETEQQQQQQPQYGEDVHIEIRPQEPSEAPTQQNYNGNDIK